MKGDFSRTLYFASKYNNLLMQQGRVQTDADFNEQVRRTELRISDQIRDFIGHAGAPATDVKANTSTAFQVTVDPQNPAALDLGPGRYYVDGLLYVNGARTPLNVPVSGLVANQWYLFYLNVWEHFNTVLDDLSLLEPALGGADTAGRVENSWVVHYNSADDDPSIYTDPAWVPGPTWNDPSISVGTFAVQAKSSAPQFENRLYRIEIHQGGNQSQATFKWSRDNGSVAARVASIQGAMITLGETLGNPAVDFAAGIWIEVKAVGAPDDQTGTLARLQAVQNNVLTVYGDGSNLQPYIPLVGDPGVIVRRWDSGDANSGDIAVNTTSDKWLTLGDDELEVQFNTDQANQFRTGDYWWFITRTATGLDWPEDKSGQPQYQPAMGITHSFSALALVQWTGSAWTGLTDLRPLFVPPGKGFVPTTGSASMAGPLTITNSLTLTEGDLQVSKGNISLAAGNLTVGGFVLSGNSRQFVRLQTETQLPPTTTWQDVNGLGIQKFSTPANAPVSVIFCGGGFNICTTETTPTCVFRLLVDAQQGAVKAYFFPAGGNTGSIDIMLQWYGILDAGPHTFQLQYYFAATEKGAYAVLSQKITSGTDTIYPDSSLLVTAL